MKLQPEVMVLCDFDGTITRQGTLDILYRNFAGCGFEYADAWSRGEISTPQELQLTFATVTATREEMEARLSQDTVFDPGIYDLLNFCRRRGFGFGIVSDGLDWVIHFLLEQHGIRDVEIYTNHVVFTPQGIRFEFPYASPDFPTRGTAKPVIIRRKQQEGKKVVFVGDGMSDTDAVWAADVIYAKDALARYCQENGLRAHLFNNLDEIVAHWQELT